MTSWFELRADDVWLVRFEYYTSAEYNEAKEKVFRDLELMRDSHKDKVLQILEVWRVQTRNDKGQVSFLLDGTREKVIHEEHPTVLEVDELIKSYDLFVM